MEENKNIIIVDKDQTHRELLESYVKTMGFNSVLFETSSEALEYIEENKPLLIISEIMLERKDSGFYLCYSVKKKYPDVPIIIVSSISNKTGIRFGLNTKEEKEWIKADVFLDKNIRFEQLQRSINQVFKNRS